LARIHLARLLKRGITTYQPDDCRTACEAPSVKETAYIRSSSPSGYSKFGPPGHGPIAPVCMCIRGSAALEECSLPDRTFIAAITDSISIPSDVIESKETSRSH
jgi:hypothetical protein